MNETQLRKAQKQTGLAMIGVGAVTAAFFIATSLSTAPDGYGSLGLVPSFACLIVFLVLLVKYIQFSHKLSKRT